MVVAVVAVVAVVVEEDAGTAGTRLPGRGARHTHTLTGWSRSPQARAVARAQVPELFDPPDPCAGIALGRAFKCWLRLSNRG